VLHPRDQHGSPAHLEPAAVSEFPESEIFTSHGGAGLGHYYQLSRVEAVATDGSLKAADAGGAAISPLRTISYQKGGGALRRMVNGYRSCLLPTRPASSSAF
jgi:hypothetical protein